MDTFLNILSLLGSLGLFLFGMKTMSEGLEKFAGDRLRSILAGYPSSAAGGDGGAIPRAGHGIAVACA